MGFYQTTTALSELLPGYLAGNTSTSDTAGVSAFSRYIDDAEAEVNSAIAIRYEMPFSTVPPLLRTLAGHIACYIAIRNGFSAEGLHRNQYLDDYKDAKAILKELMDGARRLTYTDGSLVPVNTTGRIKSSSETYTPIFGLDEPTSWDRDPDEVEDQADARG